MVYKKAISSYFIYDFTGFQYHVGSTASK